MNAVIAEYEVFKNASNALGFFFYKNEVLDHAPKDGPFWFEIKSKNIVAGSDNAKAVFEGVTDDVLSTARERGVIMLVEFQDNQAVRCTPCYLTDSL